MNDLVRQRQIVELLRDRPFTSVRELQERLGVSAATVRRDIDKIDGTGAARKVYGGISALDGAAHKAPAFARPYDENRDLAVEAKRQIAELAATMVADGDSIIVNGGSTCFHLGVKLAGGGAGILLAGFLPRPPAGLERLLLRLNQNKSPSR